MAIDAEAPHGGFCNHQLLRSASRELAARPPAQLSTESPGSLLGHAPTWPGPQESATAANSPDAKRSRLSLGAAITLGDSAEDDGLSCFSSPWEGLCKVRTRLGQKEASANTTKAATQALLELPPFTPPAEELHAAVPGSGATPGEAHSCSLQEDPEWQLGGRYAATMQARPFPPGSRYDDRPHQHQPAQNPVEPVALPRFDLQRSSIWRAGQPRGRPPRPAMQRWNSLHNTLSRPLSQQLVLPADMYYSMCGSFDGLPYSFTDVEAPPFVPGAWVAAGAATAGAAADIGPWPPVSPACTFPAWGRASGAQQHVPCRAAAAAAAGPEEMCWSPDGGSSGGAVLAAPGEAGQGQAAGRLYSPFALYSSQPYGAAAPDGCGDAAAAMQLREGVLLDQEQLLSPCCPTPTPSPAPSVPSPASPTAAAHGGTAMTDEELDDYYVSSLCGGKDPLAAFAPRLSQTEGQQQQQQAAAQKVTRQAAQPSSTAASCSQSGDAASAYASQQQQEQHTPQGRSPSFAVPAPAYDCRAAEVASPPLPSAAAAVPVAAVPAGGCSSLQGGLTGLQGSSAFPGARLLQLLQPEPMCVCAQPSTCGSSGASVALELDPEPFGAGPEQEAEQQATVSYGGVGLALTAAAAPPPAQGAGCGGGDAVTAVVVVLQACCDEHAAHPRPEQLSKVEAALQELQGVSVGTTLFTSSIGQEQCLAAPATPEAAVASDAAAAASPWCTSNSSSAEVWLDRVGSCAHCDVVFDVEALLRGSVLDNLFGHEGSHELLGQELFSHQELAGEGSGMHVEVGGAFAA